MAVSSTPWMGKVTLTTANTVYRLSDLLAALADARKPLVSSPARCEYLSIQADPDGQGAKYYIGTHATMGATDYGIYLIATQPYFYYPWFLRKPVVNYEFGIVPTRGFSWRKKAMWAYMRFTQFYVYHPAADAIVSNSEFTRRALPWLVRGKTTPIYHGVEHYDPLHPDHDKLFPSPLLEPDPHDRTTDTADQCRKLRGADVLLDHRP